MSNKSRPYVVRKSSIHNRGLYSRRLIDEGEYVIEYRGEKITKAESEKRAISQDAKGKKNGSGQVYIFELNKKYDLDGNKPGNVARFANHSCEPNCEAVNYRGRIWFVALREILPGEELTFDYGYALESALDHPCKCGTKDCVGFIVNEADRSKLKKMLRKKEKKKRLLK
ncbi:MAG: SET domain-containing protein-lysine N-methyltransferase [Verrucomicrobiota bacterium]